MHRDVLTLTLLGLLAVVLGFGPFLPAARAHAQGLPANHTT